MDLVPKAIDEYIVKKSSQSTKYWNREEFRTKSQEADLISLGEDYIDLRSKGKELTEIGKCLYTKGKKSKLPGFTGRNN